MLCQKCQATIPEGEMFCPMCGAPVPPVEAPMTESPALQEEMPTAEIPMQEMPTNEEQAPMYEWAPTPEEPAKKAKPIGWIAAAVIAVVAIVAAVVVLFMMNGGKTGLQDTWKVSLRMDKLVEIADQSNSENAMTMMYPGVDFKEMIEMFRIEEPLSAYVTFREDDSCALYVNLEQTEAFVNELYDRMLTYLQNDGYYQIMETQGISREEVDEMLAQQGMDMNTMLLMLSMSKSQLNATAIEAALAQMGIKTDDNGNAMLFETTYRYEDGTLSFAPFRGGKVEPSWSMKVSVNGNTLEPDFDQFSGAEQVKELFTIERAALPQ